MSPHLVVVGIHLQIEFLKTFANGGVFHHSHELPVSRHTPFELIELGGRFIGGILRKIILGKSLLGFFTKLVALTQLGLKKLHHLGLHLHEGQRMVLAHGAGNNQGCSCFIDQN